MIKRLSFKSMKMWKTLEVLGGKITYLVGSAKKRFGGCAEVGVNTGEQKWGPGRLTRG